MSWPPPPPPPRPGPRDGPVGPVVANVNAGVNVGGFAGSGVAVNVNATGSSNSNSNSNGGIGGTNTGTGYSHNIGATRPTGIAVPTPPTPTPSIGRQQWGYRPPPPPSPLPPPPPPRPHSLPVSQSVSTSASTSASTSTMAPSPSFQSQQQQQRRLPPPTPPPPYFHGQSQGALPPPPSPSQPLYPPHPPPPHFHPNSHPPPFQHPHGPPVPPNPHFPPPPPNHNHNHSHLGPPPPPRHHHPPPPFPPHHGMPPPLMPSSSQSPLHYPPPPPHQHPHSLPPMPTPVHPHQHPPPHPPTPPYAHTQQQRIINLPRPEPPSRPHAQAALDVYYPKAHFVHGDFGSTSIIPPVDTRSIILDDGNASPHIVTSTFYAIPKDSNMLRHTGFKAVNLLLTPMAIPAQDYTGTAGQASWLPESGRLAYVALETEPPTRCTHCHAYANPFWNASCNLCSSRVHHAGRKGVGTVDYPVDGPFITRTSPVQPHVLYAVDITAPNSIQYLRTIAFQVIPQWADQQTHTRSQNTRAAIVLVTGRGIYIPLLQGNHNGASFVVMPDIEDPFSPLPLIEFTWDLKTQRNQFHQRWTELLDHAVPHLLDSLNNDKIAGATIPGYSVSAGGAAVAFLVDALQETGGRAVYISWRRPNHGAGKLMDREAMAKDQAYKQQEPLLYTPCRNDKFYSSIATKAKESQVAIDWIIHTDPRVPKAFLDIATIQQLCQQTNGRLTWISALNWQLALLQTLTRSLQFTGWDAVLKVRVSPGLRVNALDSPVGTLRSAASLTDDSPELELPVVTPDTTIGVQLEYRVGGLPKNSSFVYIQSALLYTNPWTGQRRVRVTTLALRVASNLPVAFKSLEFSTLVATLLRQTVSMVRNASETIGDGPLILARQYAMDQLLAILSAYRKYGAGIQAKASNQLPLPERLQLLPLFVMSLIKSPLLRSSLSRRTVSLQSTIADPNADERAYHLYYASQAGAPLAFWMVHPLLIDIQAPSLKRWQQPGLHLPEDAHRLDVLKHAPYVALPDPLLLTMTELQDEKSYLLVTGLAIYVIVGKHVDSMQRSEIQSAIDSQGSETEMLSNDGSMASNLVRALQQVRVWSQVGREPRWLRPLFDAVEIVQQLEIASWLVADSTPGERDYAAFLAELQKRTLND